MRKQHLIEIDSEQFVGCGLCRDDCPASNLTLENHRAKIKTQDCIKCGHCVAICPKAAVSMTGFEEPPTDIQAMNALNPRLLLNAIKARRSIRQFTRQPVPPEMIAKVIEAGRMTPSAKNAQDVSFVVLRDGLARFEALAARLFRRLLPLMRLVNATARRTAIDDHFFFKKAPVAIVVLCPNAVNGALAASNMALVAESWGLGVLYSGFFSAAVNFSRALRKALGLKRKERAVTTLVLGYSNVAYRRTAQREAVEVRYL